MADTYSSSVALTRDYESVSPSLTTRTIEKNPPRPEMPPAPIDTLAANRSYTLKLAERMGFWAEDPVARLGGGKQRGTDTRSDAQKAHDQNKERKAWVDGIKSDIRFLWDNVGDEQGLCPQQKFEKRHEFFRGCREKFEEKEQEQQGEGVSLTEFQDVVRGLRVSLDLRLEGKGLKIMKIMATEPSQGNR